MRYVIALIVAIAFAVAAVLFISAPLASAVVQRWLFQDPDAAARTHVFIFLACTVAGFLLGWFAGWRIGGKRARG